MPVLTGGTSDRKSPLHVVFLQIYINHLCTNEQFTLAAVPSASSSVA